MIAKKSLYAIRALLELTKNFGQAPLNSAEIARKQGVSGRFIEVILNELKKAGFVESRRGSNGGYLLAERPEMISVFEIISCIDGPVSILNKTKKDREDDYFGVHSIGSLCTGLRISIESQLKNKTLRCLFDEEKEIRNKNVPNYVI